MASADTLMNTTLPTIVGAGVVSKTTDTMFSKKKSSGGKKKMAKKTKKEKTAAAKKAWKTRRKRYGKNVLSRAYKKLGFWVGFV